MSDTQVPPELLSIYLEDARGQLEILEHNLLSLEREGFDTTFVSAILGPLHTLKGNSGMIGFSSIKDYAHRLEDVFARINDGAIALRAEVFDQLFASFSALRDAVERAGVAGDEVRDLRAEQAPLDALLGEGAPGATAAPSPSPAALHRPAKAPQAAQYVAARTNMIRVDFGRLDLLLNQVGELIIHRTKLQELGRGLAERLGGGQAGRELLEAIQQVGSIGAQLQETVMQIRMLPVRNVFERFPRLVRDLARQQGKELELIVEGESTRVDKAIIDEIGEPLLHMIRNSIDHGIERPAVRIARGKTPTGTILLSAAQESNHVVLTIMDDGAGIDASEVRRKAVERGILKADEVIADRDAVQLIFSQGFSTSDVVTDVSGRGVGLDVVLKAIERLNGLVEVETVAGVGTRFVIQLPLTLAIISALLVEAGGRTYALPLPSVVESLKLDVEEVHRIAGRSALRIRDRIVPLVGLSQLFGLEGAGAPGRSYVVVLGRGEKRLGLVVDRLKGQQEIVIKALDPAVSKVAFGIAGATIMGDGRVVLIVDVAALFEGKRMGSFYGGGESAAVPREV